MLCQVHAPYLAGLAVTLCPQPGLQVPPHMGVAENRAYRESYGNNDGHDDEGGP
jgi:hypothetical protein